MYRIKTFITQDKKLVMHTAGPVVRNGDKKYPPEQKAEVDDSTPAKKIKKLFNAHNRIPLVYISG